MALPNYLVNNILFSILIELIEKLNISYSDILLSFNNQKLFIMKNAKTPLMRILRKLSNVTQISKTTGIPTNELMNPEHPFYSRRDFLETTAKAGVIIGIASSLPFIIRDV